MAPPRTRKTTGKLTPRWGVLATEYYEKRSTFSSEFKIKRVVDVSVVDSDSKAGTTEVSVKYEYEPLEEGVDCRELGSEHEAYGEDHRIFSFAMRETGEWRVTSMADHLSGDPDKTAAAADAGPAIRANSGSRPARHMPAAFDSDTSEDDDPAIGLFS